MPDKQTIQSGANRELKTLEIALSAKIRRTAISIEEYIAIRVNQGVSLETIQADLLADLEEGGRIFGEFRRAIETTYNGSVSRFRDVAQVAEVGLKAKFRWVAVLIDTCPDCLERHGRTMTWDDWEQEGLPRTGQTVCKENCKCVLIPAEATELLPIKRG
jgi:hypothetical protein